MDLSSGTKIGRYEIRSLLGAGGMGEVYRAFDTQLERFVALKFLKQTDDAEKLRRFRQEAKAVSALNHPNILTIYEVGEYENHQFIVSELVNGRSLRDFISEKNTSLGEILDICIQTGNALAAAHAVGIVHRDIKPENIMVLPDGYVKVLDFGLAKFIGTDKDSTNDSAVLTASLIQTRAGMIIGTVNYMSPEQLRGKTIDERTDLWSLGIVLFEMLTRRRPFAGESVSDIIAAVLEHSLPLISQFDGNVPLEIETIVNKALEKDKNKRFQNAAEFVSELKKAKSVSENYNWTAANKSAFSNSFHSQKTLAADAGQTALVSSENLSGIFIAGTKIRWHLIVLPALLLLLAASVSGWFYIYQPFIKKSSAGQTTVQRLGTTGNVVNAAISPDGRWVVYVQNNNGQQSLWLKQINETSSGKELIPAKPASYSGLTFKPDGNWIYFTIFDSSGTGTLQRIRTSGGSQQEIFKDVDSAVSFAPDGKNFAFFRSNPNEGVNQIVVSNIDGIGERVLSEKKRPEFYMISARESLSWSPDGKFIACPFGKIEPDGEFMSVAEIEVETGREKPLTNSKWYRVGRVLWTKNADELLITAAEAGSESFQIRKIYRSSGQTQNIAGGFQDYYNLSLNSDSTILLGVAYDKTSNLYIAPGEQPSHIKRFPSGNYDGIGGVRWTADDRIIYVSMESGNRDIWIRNADGSNPQQLTTDKSADDYPRVSNDGKYIVFVSSRTGVPHIWRMNREGGELKQLTDEGGENLPSVTPDGNFVIFSKAEERPVLWKISIEGGEPVQLTKEQTRWSAISPDGKFIACLTRAAAPESPPRLALVSVETGEILRTFEPSGILNSPGLAVNIRWLPDSQKFAYVADNNDVSNVWTQAVAGGAPQKITDFTNDKIFSFDLSKDGKKIIYARGMIRNDLVLVENF